MCGILGQYTKHPVENNGQLLNNRDSMKHRGPDDEGVWWSSDHCIGLAHRRLSIIDISQVAHQPMVDESGNYVIVFNGEIYNYRELKEMLKGAGHRFHSNSDTEVILESYKKWGRDCLLKLTGAFAFAIYDKARRELFLARDRAGEKPLFYKKTEKRFDFASELKALMEDPGFSRDLDYNSLDYYLAYGYVAGDQTMLRGTHKLPPGHAMVLKLENMELAVWRYWDLPTYMPNSISAEEATEELELLLTDAVRRQLVADVPVGILLSGGLDSSLITAVAAKVSDLPIKTFTITFPGYGSFDEGPYARLVAGYFGTEHTELSAEPASVNILPEIARQYDEPIADHSVVPTSILSGLVKRSVSVALGGDGGDELFGGYPHYNFLQKIEQVRGHIPECIRKMGALFASRVLPVGVRGRNHMIGLDGRWTDSISAVNVYFDKRYRQKLLTNGYRPQIGPESKKASLTDPLLSVLQNATRTDFRTTMVDDYLVKSDRASMLHSLELRAPFLDHKLIEFAFGTVPDHLRATQKDRKVLLRLLAKRILPKELDIQRKQGFSLPLNLWFKGEWGRFMTEVLMDGQQSVFDKKVVSRLIKGQRLGFSNANRLFALTMFELWRREYEISI